MKKYIDIVKHYENCFEIHGDSHRGVDWPDKRGMNLRYEIMLGLLKNNNEYKREESTLLDLGCGTAGLYKWMKKKEITNIKYEGMDISNKFIDYCEKKYPSQKFYCQDILVENVKKKI